MGFWINLSETIRWLFLIESYWVEYYQKLGLIFPKGPLSAIIWMIWGFLFAILLYVLSKKYNTIKTTLISWFAVFVMLWIVLWNVNILPVKILWIVVPLSFVETYIGALIYKKLSNKIDSIKM